MSEKDFLRMMIDKAESSYCQPGEAVGLLCAQVSIAPRNMVGSGGYHGQEGSGASVCMLMLVSTLCNQCIHKVC